jgi:rhodanese-related sulfurtransferase
MDQIEFYEDKLKYETDPADLKAALDQGENIVVIDARSNATYSEEHISGAINIPHRTMDASTTADIDRSARIVTYCDGIGCNASTRGALNMTKLGFNVKELMGGLVWWKQDGYATETA